MPCPRRCLLSLALLVALASGATSRAAPPASEVPPVKGTWIQARSAHFTLSSDAPEKRTVGLAVTLERFRAALSLFHARFTVDAPRPTLIYVFRSDRDYRPFKKDFSGSLAKVAGFFHPSDAANYVTLEAVSERDALPIIYHEFLHQITADDLPSVPVWFDEGIAEYYSTFQADEGRRSEVGPFLDRLHDGMPLDEAFRISVRLGYEGLRAEIMDYALRRRFPYATVHFAPSLNVDTTVRFREAGRHYEAARTLDPGTYLYAYLAAGALLGKPSRGEVPAAPATGVASGERERARDLPRTSIRLRPDFAEAYVDLGETSMGSREEAGEGIRLLEKARGLLPSRMDLVADLISLCLLEEDRRRAGDLLKNVLARSDDRSELEWARKVVADYDSSHAPAGAGPQTRPAGDSEPAPEEGIGGGTGPPIPS